MRRLMYAVAARGPQRCPLPWGGDGPQRHPAAPGGEVQTEERPEPDYMVFLSDEELTSLHAAIVARQQLLGRVSRLPLAALAYSVLIEDGAMRRLLDLDLPDEQRAEAISDLRAAIEGMEAIEAVHERLTGTKPMLSDISGSLETLLAPAADDRQTADRRRDSEQAKTWHQAKGLGFQVVFCSGFAHGLFPLPARPHPLLDEQDRAWLPGFKLGF